MFRSNSRVGYGHPHARGVSANVRARGTLRTGAFLCALWLVASCSSMFPTTYRYRMTVNVNAGGRIISGSSIVEVATSRGSGVPNSALRERIRGEAAAVRLPSGALVLVLLNDANYGDAAQRLAFAAYGASFTDIGPDPDTFALLKRLKAHREIVQLPRGDYPMVIKFENLNDPRSAVLADPGSIEIYRGGRVFIESIKIQITSDSLEYKLADMFPWWDDYLDKYLDGGTISITKFQDKSVRARVGPRSMSTEMLK